jgi:hypothetical protein
MASLHHKQQQMHQPVQLFFPSTLGGLQQFLEICSTYMGDQCLHTFIMNYYNSAKNA